jgi:hypothetical protein
MTPRKRGAQPGNTNALRHGFYSRSLRQSEANDLDQINGDDFSSEINMLRAVTRRIFEISDGVTDLDQAMRLLSTMGASATRLSNMIYKRRLLRNLTKDTDFQDALNQAIRETMEEFRARKANNETKQSEQSMSSSDE